MQRSARSTPRESSARGPGSSLGTAETQERRRFVAASLALGLLVLLVFGRAVASDFVLIDDPTYVTNNEWVRQGLTVDSIGRAFGEVRASNWHPLTWISHMLDVEVYGMRPWGHHLTNLLLHALGTVLLGVALRRMTGAPWASLLAAALYGLHPLRVESVVWVAERKDLLAAAFGMLTLVCYAAYARRGGLGRYLATALCLGLGLLSKPTLVTLPFLMLLLDAWPLHRRRPATAGRGSRRALFEKIPLLVLAAASSLATLWSQGSGGALVEVERLPLLARVPNAALSYGAYLLDVIWPSGLAIHYPHPWTATPDRWTGLYLPALVAGVLLFALSAVAWRFRRSRP